MTANHADHVHSDTVSMPTIIKRRVYQCECDNPIVEAKNGSTRTCKNCGGVLRSMTQFLRDDEP